MAPMALMPDYFHTTPVYSCAFAPPTTNKISAMGPLAERVPLQSSSDIWWIEGVACMLKRDANIFVGGVVEKGV